MCLFSKRKYCRISLRRIPIWKVVTFSNYYVYNLQGEREYIDIGILTTPYRSQTIKSNVLIPDPNTYTPPEKVMSTEHVYADHTNRGKGYLFNGGFIHAFTSLSSASRILNWHRNRFVIKGYIPPFTRYAIDKEFGEICAKKIIIEDDISEYL